MKLDDRKSEEASRNFKKRQRIINWKIENEEFEGLKIKLDRYT